MSLRSSFDWIHQRTLPTADLCCNYQYHQNNNISNSSSNSSTQKEQVTDTRSSPHQHYHRYQEQQQQQQSSQYQCSTSTPPSSSTTSSSSCCSSSYLYFYQHQTSPYFMIRRACSSARRRLNSDDSNNNTKAMRSRSQERSLQHQQEHHHQQQQHQQDRTIREESSFRGGSQASSTDAGNNSEHGSIDALIQDILLDDLSNNNNTSSIGDVEMNGARRPFPTSKSDSEVKTMADAVNRNQVIILNGSSSYKQSQQQQQQQQQQSSKTSPRNKKKSSKGVVPKSPNYYCRSQSEPMGFPGLADDNYNNKDFDNFEEEEATAAAAADVEIVAVKSLDNDIGTSSSGIRSASMSVPIPTLLRYPVSETRDLNCWSETPLNIFKVRGSNYLNDKKKVASDAYLMRARGCDLLLFPTDKQQQQQPPATVMERSSSLLNGTLRKEPTLVLNFRFPWGVMLLYFEIPAKILPFMKHVPQEQCYRSGNATKKRQENTCPDLNALSPGERTLARWIMGDAHYKNQRLKLIPYVVKGPWVVRNLVTGKPAIIGTKLPVTYRCQDSNLLVAELDIGNSSNTAKRIVSVCRRYMSALTCDIGFVIQGNTTDELPEQMLGSVRVHGIDPLKAPTLY